MTRYRVQLLLYDMLIVHRPLVVVLTLFNYYIIVIIIIIIIFIIIISSSSINFRIIPHWLSGLFW